MKLTPKTTASALSVLALAGLLAGCDKKSEDTSATPSASVSATTAASASTDSAATTETGDVINREHEGAMSDDMAKRHGQEMDHETMRRGPMGPMGPRGTPTATDSQAAQ